MGLRFFGALSGRKAAAVVVGVLCIVNTVILVFVGREVAAMKAEPQMPCVADVWHISYSQTLTVTSDKGKSQDEMRKELTDFMQKVQMQLGKPERYGCTFVAVKGSILSGARDITEKVMKDVK